MDRSIAHEVVDSEREARRVALGDASKLAGKVGRRASTLLLDIEHFDEWVASHGDEESMTRWLCAQVASGVTLRAMCEYYEIEYGLLWEWVSSDAERMGRYYRAQRGLADGMVGEVVGIADGGGDVGRDKLRVDARLKVAGKYDRERFGEQRDGGVVIDMRDRKDPEALLAELRALTAANPALLDQLGMVPSDSLVSDVVVDALPADWTAADATDNEPDNAVDNQGGEGDSSDEVDPL